MYVNASNPNKATEKLLRYNQLYIAAKEGQYGEDVGFNTVYAVKPDVSTTETIIKESTDSIIIPSTADNFGVASNSSDDTLLGTGCRTIYVEGLDENGDKVNETLNMNGVTPAYTTGLFSRVNRMFSVTAGSTSPNIGTIRCGTGAFTAGVPANIYTTMIPDIGWTRQAVCSLPTGYFPVLMQCTIYAGAGREVEFSVYGKFDNGGWIKTFTFAANESVTNVKFAVGGIYYDKMDIQVKAKSLIPGQTVNTFFLCEFVLIDQDLI